MKGNTGVEFVSKYRYGGGFLVDILMQGAIEIKSETNVLRSLRLGTHYKTTLIDEGFTPFLVVLIRECSCLKQENLMDALLYCVWP